MYCASEFKLFSIQFQKYHDEFQKIFFEIFSSYDEDRDDDVLPFVYIIEDDILFE